MLTEKWRKSNRSGGPNNCVEARYENGTVFVRDSKNPNGPALAFTRDEWEAFQGGAADGDFTLPTI
jgi:hypothetical protein